MDRLSRRAFLGASSFAALAALTACGADGTFQPTLQNIQDLANEVAGAIGAALPAFLPTMADIDKAAAQASYTALVNANKALQDVKTTATNWFAVAKDAVSALVVAAKVIVPYLTLPASIAGPLGTVISILSTIVAGGLVAATEFVPHPALHPVAVRITLERAGFHLAPSK